MNIFTSGILAVFVVAFIVFGESLCASIRGYVNSYRMKNGHERIPE